MREKILAVAANASAAPRSAIPIYTLLRNKCRDVDCVRRAHTSRLALIKMLLVFSVCDAKLESHTAAELVEIIIIN